VQEFPVRRRRFHPAEASTSGSGLIAREVEACDWSALTLEDVDGWRDPRGRTGAFAQCR
jgi:hypothetical protein